MDDLLTARQVQEILKVDRITVYRMLQDGRLKGFKIGQQWRFSRDEVERVAGGSGDSPAAAGGDPSFPTHCVQTIQDLFADLSQMAALVVDMDGMPLTQMSGATRLHRMLAETAAGREALQAAWKAFACSSASGSKFFTCPAGLAYVGAPINDREQPIAVFLAGQFHWQTPEPRAQAEQVRRLAEAYRLPLAEVEAAAAEIPVVEPALHARVEAWPFTAARAVQSILRERLGFVERLQRIAHLTQIS